MTSLRRRIHTWWTQRHPLTDSWTLTQANVYILPTKAGFVYALTLFVMLLASINYQLSLGYVLTFLLAGSGLMSMHLTHRTLRGLTLRLRPPAGVFAGEPAPLEIVLQSAGRWSHGVGLRLDSDAGAQPPVWVDVPAQGQASARLSFVPAHRGLHAVPTVRAETRYPFGLFRAWTIWRPAGQQWVYPRPESPTPPWPQVEAAQGDDRPAARTGAGSDFEGVRAYRRGDTLRQVVWKKAARTGELVSRETAGAVQREMWLQWQQAQGLEVEARLSRLTAWVLAAEAAGHVWGLRLPGVELDPDHGSAHRHAALQALAQA